jgi:exopolysaccharide biosynthesis protein
MKIILFITAILSSTVTSSYISFTKEIIQPELVLHKYNFTFQDRMPQMVNTLTFNYKKYKTFISYSMNDKYTVKEFINKADIKVVAGINGGYHDFNPNTKYTGGITKLRVNGYDIVTENDMIENGLTKENSEGVLGIEESGKIYIFQNTNQKTIDKLPTFLYSGPLLLLNSKIQTFDNTTWNNVRNPRTAICTSKFETYIKFIVVDGRNTFAKGMTISEFAQFLKIIGCRNAINLDGGGSSLMYIKNKGIVNKPMSKTYDGLAINVERKNSNAILIKTI